MCERGAFEWQHGWWRLLLVSVSRRTGAHGESRVPELSPQRQRRPCRENWWKQSWGEAHILIIMGETAFIFREFIFGLQLNVVPLSSFSLLHTLAWLKMASFFLGGGVQVALTALKVISASTLLYWHLSSTPAESRHWVWICYLLKLYTSFHAAVVFWAFCGNHIKPLCWILGLKGEDAVYYAIQFIKWWKIVKNVHHNFPEPKDSMFKSYFQQ